MDNSSLGLITIIISVVSVLLNIFFTVVNRFSTKKEYRNQHSRVIFEKIFLEYMIEKIPQSLLELEFIDGVLSDTYRSVNGLLLEMKEKSEIYYYINKKFYNDLEKIIIDIDDKLIIVSDLEYSETNQMFVRREIDELFSSLFAILNKEYYG